jgi:hypothetical protein
VEAGGGGDEIVVTITGGSGSVSDTTLHLHLDGVTEPLLSGRRGAIRFGRTYQITRWTVLAQFTESLSLDLRVGTYAAYSNAGFDASASICGASPPSLSFAMKGTSTSFLDWSTTQLAQDQILEVHLSSDATSSAWIALDLELLRV